MKKLFKNLIPFLLIALVFSVSGYGNAAPMQGVGLKKFNTQVSSFAPLPFLNETIIEDFTSGHGWIKQSAAGTQSDDTTDFIVGDQSLKLSTEGAGAAVFTRSGVLSPTVDLSGKQIVLRFKIDDVSVPVEFWFYASSDSFVSAFYTWKVSDSGLTNWVIDGEWFVVTLNFSDATVSGSPNRAAINKFQWRMKDDSATAINCNLNYIGSFPEPTVGVVTFAFDDGWDSQFTEAKKKLSTYGFPAIDYVISDLIGTAGYMTLENTRELQNIHYWDIGTHHQTNLTTVGLSAAESFIKKEKQWHVDNGLNRGADHFAIPNGAFDVDLLSMFRKYFRTVRTIGVTAETFPPADWGRLRIFNVVNTTTTAAVATAVDNARTNKYWLILVFHKIVTTPAISTEYSIADFGTIVDDVAVDGIPVKTVTQMIIDG